MLRLLGIAMLVLAAALPAPARAAELSLTNGLVTLDAPNSTLGEVLRAFARQGIRVRVAPGLDLDRDVTIDRRSRRPERLFDELIASDGYVLLWERERPGGSKAHLREIRVIGSVPDAPLRELPTEDPATGISRQRFVPGQVLLRLAPGVALEAVRPRLESLGLTPLRLLPELGLVLCRCDPGRTEELAEAAAGDEQRTGGQRTGKD